MKRVPLLSRSTREARNRLHHRALAFAATAGATAVTYSYLEPQRRPLRGCHVCTVPEALAALQASGVGVVDGIVGQALIRAVKDSAAYQSMPVRVVRARERAPPEWRQSAFGRFHCREEQMDASSLSVIEEVEKRVMPLVVAFFEDGSKEGMQDVYRSELQASPCPPPGIFSCQR